ncbi:hypothetical protein D3C85_1665740 [compost metagenome]
MAFHPTLAFKLTSLHLQRGNGPRQIAGFVAQVGVGDLAVQLARRQFINRHADTVERHTNGITD